MARRPPQPGAIAVTESRFTDAAAIVTGAGSGIGLSLARLLTACGARVAVIDVDETAARDVAFGLAQARAYACDVADPVAMQVLATRIAEDFGGTNYLFNNAGVIVGGPADITRPPDAQWMFAVNVLGTLYGIQAFLPLLRQAASRGEPAHIINTGSENSLGVPVIGPTSVYTATKHAVLGLSDALRRDLAGTGIAVSILCPGLVKTRIADARRNRPANYGGPKPLTAEQLERIRTVTGNGQDPDVTARICLDGVASGEFMIIADPAIRGFATRRHREVEAALDLADRRMETA
jgi:NAD(P)-dependent dehydrogenase (short-subunit alcohol dehydrogenase family)